MQQTGPKPYAPRGRPLVRALPILLLAIGWTVGCADVDFQAPRFPDTEWRLPGDTTGQVRVVWDWREQIQPGRQIEIKTVSGDIRAIATSGSDVVVTATKIGRPSDVARVSIDVVTHASGVTICAVYPDVAGRTPNTCEPGDAGSMSVWDGGDGTVRVDFAVEVPAGVALVGRTLAGDIVATELSSDVHAHSLVGDVRLSTSRLATATTQWGSISATLGLPDWGRDIEFSTLGGDIGVTVPATTNALVEATSRTGNVTSDFPLVRVAPGRLEGTLGNGGPRLTLSTLSGSVTLRRDR